MNYGGAQDGRASVFLTQSSGEAEDVIFEVEGRRKDDEKNGSIHKNISKNLHVSTRSTRLKTTRPMRPLRLKYKLEKHI